MIDDCNMNNLAKNQVSAVVNSCAIRRSVSSKFIEIFMETPSMLVPIRMGTNMAVGNQQEHLSLSFATKAKVYLSRNSKTLRLNTFPNAMQEPVQRATFPEISPEISHLLTNSAVL